MIEHLEAGRRRDEVDAVAAEVGMRLAVTGVERERVRGIGDGAFYDGPREQDPVAGGVRREAGLEQTAAHLLATDLHPDVGQDALRFVDDAIDEFGCEDVQARAHAVLQANGGERSAPGPALESGTA
jgi:hypothetical protein